MRTMLKPLLTTIVVIAVAGILGTINGCKPQETPSLYDPNWKSLPQPIVDSLSPGSGAINGLDTIKIYGQNFSSNTQEDVVFLNSAIATVVFASPTRLDITAPSSVSGDSVQVRVSVIGAEKFSPVKYYRIRPGVSAFGNLLANEAAYSVAVDANGNLLASLAASGASEGIALFKPDGTRQNYITDTKSAIYWNSMRVGPGGYVYAVKGLGAIYRYGPGATGSQATLWVAITRTGTLVDIDFDANKNLWAGGNNPSIYMVTQTKQVKSFAFNGNVRGLRVYNGYLYIAAIVGGNSQIYRAQIVGDSITTPQVYFNMSGVNANATSLTFSNSGNMYVGLDGGAGLIVVPPGGSTYTAPYASFSSILSNGIISLTMTPDGTLYAASGINALLRILTHESGALYYGFQ
ncbi:MAG: IPT/TIG domain-containing protein [Candidatus Kryptoniota bacterium]